MTLMHHPLHTDPRHAAARPEHRPQPMRRPAQARARAASRPTDAAAPLRRLALLLALTMALAAAFLARPARAETEVQIVTSPGGITAWLVREPAIPMLALEISFDTGARLDPPEAQGATYFLSTMLDEGTGDMDGAAYQAAAQTLALRYGFSAGRESFSVSAKMLTENLDESVALLRAALTAPRFDAEPLERMRASILSDLRSDEADPDHLAARAWRKAVYGGDVQARDPRGSAADVEKISAEDLRAARLRALNRRGMSIGAVGDVSPEQLGLLLDRLLGDLPDAPLPQEPVLDVKTDGALQVVTFDTPQAVARLVGPGLRRHDPDFFPAYVMNHILGGGGFTSRLMVEVREKRGLTYGVWSYLVAEERQGLYVAGVSSDNKRIGTAVEVIKAEWRRMAEQGPTAAELEAAKRYLTGAYPLRFDSNGKIARQLVGIMSLGYTPDYIRKRNAWVEAVTLEDVKRVAKRLLDADGLHVTVVGKPEGLPGSPAGDAGVN